MKQEGLLTALQTTEEPSTPDEKFPVQLQMETLLPCMTALLVLGYLILHLWKEQRCKGWTPGPETEGISWHNFQQGTV